MIRIVDFAAVALTAVCVVVACSDASDEGDGNENEAGVGGSMSVPTGVGGGSVGAARNGIGGGVGGTQPEATGGTGPLPGESVYSAPCSAPNEACGEGLACVPFSLGEEGSVGYACSGTCPNGVEDCSDPPAGSSAAIGCWQFSTADRCILICEYNGQYFDCPAGMSCIRSADGRVGYCLWTS